MTERGSLEEALRNITGDLRGWGVQFALVGGLAISVRAEIRFTRDVDLAVLVKDDPESEQLVHALRARGYVPVASVEHETQRRLATVRLMSSLGVKVDLLFARSGIEREIVERATQVDLPNVGRLNVARAEELLAMKVLSMTDRRLQDKIDAQNLLELAGPALEEVRDNLQLIETRGYAREQDLLAKLQSVIS